MQFFASWWERFPKREAAPVLAAVLVFGLSGVIAKLLHVLPHVNGWSWG
jgi:hypothetical protein